VSEVVLLPAALCGMHSARISVTQGLKTKTG